MGRAATQRAARCRRRRRRKQLQGARRAHVAAAAGRQPLRAQAAGRPCGGGVAPWHGGRGGRPRQPARALVLDRAARQGAPRRCRPAALRGARPRRARGHVARLPPALPRVHHPPRGRRRRRRLLGGTGGALGLRAPLRDARRAGRAAPRGGGAARGVGGAGARLAARHRPHACRARDHAGGGGARGAPAGPRLDSLAAAIRLSRPVRRTLLRLALASCHGSPSLLTALCRATQVARGVALGLAPALCRPHVSGPVGHALRGRPLPVICAAAHHGPSSRRLLETGLESLPPTGAVWLCYGHDSKSSPEGAGSFMCGVCASQKSVGDFSTSSRDRTTPSTISHGCSLIITLLRLQRAASNLVQQAHLDIDVCNRHTSTSSSR
eukprot:scaffold72053_cov63-Phaeocystis_antarctica.AAC.9